MAKPQTGREVDSDSRAPARQTWSLGNAESAVQDTLREWRNRSKGQRLWEADASLVLTERRRRVLRVHLGADVRVGLRRLREIVQRSVSPA